MTTTIVRPAEPTDSGGNVFEVWRYEKGLNDRD